jgi:inositol transport system permease protein
VTERGAKRLAPPSYRRQLTASGARERLANPGLPFAREVVRPSRKRLAILGVRYGMFAALLLWIVVMSFASPYFLTQLNFLNVARQAAPVIIIAIGMTFVMATAGIDLSVGSLVALVSTMSAALFRLGLPTAAVVPLLIALGAAAGGVNGAFICLGLPPFVVTLASLVYLRGIAFVYSSGYAVPIQDPGYLAIGRGGLGEFHYPILIAAAIALAGWFMLNRTRFGIHTLAVGGDEEAARVMGLKIRRIKLAIYALTGALGALGGIVVTARLANGSPNAGVMMELDVISAVVLGGTSLFGGVATIGGTVVGALFLNFVRNGLNLLGVNPFWVQVVTGFILLLAVLLNTLVNRRVDEWARTAPAGEGEP